jgi:hypothetical protein
MRRHSLALFTLAFIGIGLAAQTPPPPPPDRRVGLKAGITDAAQAAWNMRLVANVPRPAGFVSPTDPGDFNYMNSDLAFDGTHLFQGNFQGFLVWDIANPAQPVLLHAHICPEQQNDVSVYRNLLFLSGESNNGRLDCGTQGVPDTVSAERMRGIRIFDIADVTHPRQVATVQTCRGSHTHTLVTDPRDTTAVYIYVSGQAPVRSPSELAGCSSVLPEQDTTSALFRIDIIRVPLAAPQEARIVNRPRIFEALAHPKTHGAVTADSIEAARAADSARARGAYTAFVEGQEMIVPDEMVSDLLAQLVAQRHGTGAPTAADSATLRQRIQAIADQLTQGLRSSTGQPLGPDQCHDITVYPAIGLGGGACAGYGLLLDIKDPTHPVRLAAAADSNFAYWHSATFNHDGTKVLFTDEWGGGTQARCRTTDRPEWGADAIFTVTNGTLQFQSYYKLPAPQTAQENCVAHNGSIIPVPGRDVMVQGWYQGGVSVFDWTDPKHPFEIAYFDRGPMDSTKMLFAGSWSAYWYNGYIYSSEIGRGLDVLELRRNALLTQNEIDAAKTVQVASQNVQQQQRVTWPASFVLARAYLDQLQRARGLGPDQLRDALEGLGKAERATGAARQQALNGLATDLDKAARRAADPKKVGVLAAVVRDLAQAQ